MKKVLMTLFCLVLILALLAACAPKEASTEESSTVTEETTAMNSEEITDDVTSVEPSEMPSEVTSQEPDAKEWTIKIGDIDLTSSTIGESTETVKQTLKTISEDGTTSEHECKGYILANLLATVGVTEFVTLGVITIDGVESSLAIESAMLDTTMIVIEQDGEMLDTPVLAIDGATWVGNVAELKVG